MAKQTKVITQAEDLQRGMTVEEIQRALDGALARAVPVMRIGWRGQVRQIEITETQE